MAIMRAPALSKVIFIWDENIISVTNSRGISWNNSGEPCLEYTFDSSTNSDLFTVTLKDGYILDTVTLRGTQNNITISDITSSTFKISGDTNAMAGFGGCTLTSKQATSKVSIDLTTLTDWDNVTDGEHQISVVAKATGYRDSEKSAPVTFTKASAPIGETWVLNEFNGNLTASAIDVNTQFTSNNTNYTRFRCVKSDPFTTGIYYDDVQVWNSSDDYTNQAYRTITFETAPTGDLLTWLQNNGTKQGGTATAHKLTWSDSTMIVTVNGNAATSPYTLANGDEISLKRTSGYQSINIITDTGAFDTDTTQSPLAVSNSDIKLQNGNVEMSPSMKFGFAINYTE